MTQEKPPDLDHRRKRLRYRSWHRGMREVDLLLGPFADRSLAALSTEQLDRYETLLDQGDPDLLAWIVDRMPVPEALDSDVMALLKGFKFDRS